MEAVTEITIFLENHPGSLARVASSLAERGINILGFTLTNALDHGALRMVLSSPAEALHLFEEHNALTIENEILSIELRNEPGALQRLADVLSEAQVNIEYAYGSTARPDTPTLYLRVSDLAKARAALAGLEGVG